MWVCRSTFILSLYPKHRTTFLAGAQRRAALELLDHRLDLLAEVHRLEGGVVEQVAALAAVPAQVVRAAGELRHLDDQADGPGRALRRVRHARRQQEQLALADRHVARLAVVDDLEND